MLFVRQFRILPLVNVPKVRYFWILMNSFRIYYLFTNFFLFTFFTGTRELNSPYVACVPADMDLSTISCLRDSDCSFGLSCQDWQCRPATARARTRKRIRWLADGSDLCWPIHLLSSIERGCFEVEWTPTSALFLPSLLLLPAVIKKP